jgi:hypothetical protein
MYTYARVRPCGSSAHVSAVRACGWFAHSGQARKRKRILRLLLLKRIFCFLPNIVSLGIKAVSSVVRPDSGGGAPARQRVPTVLVADAASGGDVEVFTHRSLYMFGMRRRALPKHLPASSALGVGARGRVSIVALRPRQSGALERCAVRQFAAVRPMVGIYGSYIHCKVLWIVKGLW